MPSITPLYASFLAVMFLVLSYHVIFLRYKLKIPVGDGGNEEMQQLLQARSNMVDYVPLGLLLLLILELMEMKGLILHALGIGIIISRLLQGWGLSMSSGASLGRILGSILIHMVMVSEVVLCLWQFIFYKLS